MYSVKEIFYTIQGEGGQAGRAAVFLRFAGCNLWTGREQDREKAICKFCDTDFVGTDGENGGKFRFPMELAARVKEIWQGNVRSNPLVVCTGGEPLLQLDEALIRCLKQQGIEIAVETNGTQKAPAGIDWICVSPKSSAKVIQTWGNELKLVYPQADARPEKFQYMAFDNFYLQPMDGPDQKENIRATIEYVQHNPQWRLSLQTHKMVGLK